VRVAELYEQRKFRIVDGNVTPPGPGEVQVRVRSVGICGSDLHYYSDGFIGDVKIHYPVVLGHEPTGEVLKAGSGVSGVSRGDRVMLEPAVYCYHCEFCRSGHHNVCENIRFFSSPPDPGFFREVMNVPVQNVLPLAPSLDLDVGTLFEPLAVTVHSMEFARIRLGETVAVFGAGPIGLLTIACARAAGAGRVWSIEPLAHRREHALRIGADAAIDPQQTDPVHEILHDTSQRGVHVAIDCATKDHTTQQCVDVVRNRGRVVVTGIPSELETGINLHVLRRKEAVLFNTRRSNHETEAAIEMLVAAPERFAPLITHRIPLEEAGRAFEFLETGQGGAAKIVIRI
jgi:L-iditol 2-dehydrogenase